MMPALGHFKFALYWIMEASDPLLKRAPLRRLVTIEDVAAMATGLVSDGAKNVTDNNSYVDAEFANSDMFHKGEHVKLWKIEPTQR